MSKPPVRFGFFPGGYRKALTLSYDDGCQGDRQLAALFDTYGLHGTFHLNGGALDAAGRLTRTELPTLFAQHEVSCHARSHPSLPQIPATSLLREMLDDRHILEQAIGYPVRGLSYPYGTYDDTVIAALRSMDFTYARTVQSTHAFALPNDFLAWHPTCHHNDRLLERLEEFHAFPHRSRLPVMYVWGHSYEFDQQKNWGLMEEFCKRASEMEDTWFATNRDIVSYIEALRRLEFTVDQTAVYNPSARSLWIEVANEAVEIAAGTLVTLK